MNEPPTITEVTGAIGPTGSISHAIIGAVAEAEGVAKTDLEPLYTVCDPDALDSLFWYYSQQQSAATGQVRFRYHGYDVFVHADGQVWLLDQNNGSKF